VNDIIVKFMSTTNDRFADYAGYEGSLRFVAIQDIVYFVFETRAGVWVRSSAIVKVGQEEAIVTINTLNSVYVFEQLPKFTKEILTVEEFFGERELLYVKGEHGRIKDV